MNRFLAVYFTNWSVEVARTRFRRTPLWKTADRVPLFVVEEFNRA